MTLAAAIDWLEELYELADESDYDTDSNSDSDNERELAIYIPVYTRSYNVPTKGDASNGETTISHRSPPPPCRKYR